MAQIKLYTLFSAVCFHFLIVITNRKLSLAGPNVIALSSRVLSVFAITFLSLSLLVCLFFYLPRTQLRDVRITLNYKDSVGDLIEITDDSDLQLMVDAFREKKTSRFQHQPSVASWVLHITRQGDASVYNTNPYQ